MGLHFPVVFKRYVSARTTKNSPITMHTSAVTLKKLKMMFLNFN